VLCAVLPCTVLSSTFILQIKRIQIVYLNKHKIRIKLNELIRTGRLRNFQPKFVTARGKSNSSKRERVQSSNHFLHSLLFSHHILFFDSLIMERIHVTVRARPLSPEDAKTTLWRISDNSIFIPNHTSKFEFGTLHFHFISISISYTLFNFKLCYADQIFNENCKTCEVYEARTKDIVAAAVRGFNGLQDIFYLLFCLFFGCCFGL
jgi:hypothetical protein